MPECFLSTQARFSACEKDLWNEVGSKTRRKDWASLPPVLSVPIPLLDQPQNKSGVQNYGLSNAKPTAFRKRYSSRHMRLADGFSQTDIRPRGKIGTKHYTGAKGPLFVGLHGEIKQI